MDYESSVSAEISAERAIRGKRHAMEDIIFLIMGDASLGSMLVMLFAIMFFGATPFAMLLVFGTGSGGMAWLITLALVAAMGFVAVYLMKRGVERKRAHHEKKAAQTEFRGELTSLTETVGRASTGYVYSQQMLRERLCEAMLNKLHTARDLDMDEMAAMLESKDAGFVGDEVLAKFLLDNRRGTTGWEDSQFQAKGKSAERGSKVMSEIDEIMRRMEAMV